MKQAALLLIAALCTANLRGQLLVDPLENDGDETYTGFSAGNWVDGSGYGIPNHAGSVAFLSYLGGSPIPDIGMEKPLDAIIGSGSYRVSFWYGRYGNGNPVLLSSYDELYIGSPDGSMAWDSVPAPGNGEWVKWSGVFTPAPGDIGTPFRFGFTMDLGTGSSLAIDGPLTITDLSTTIGERNQSGLQVLAPVGSDQVIVLFGAPLQRIEVFDGLGRVVMIPSQRTATGWELSTAGLTASSYAVIATDASGRSYRGRFVRP